MSDTFRHEALLYEGVDDFVAKTVPFIREGLEADEPVAVAVVPKRIDALREALDQARGDVVFVDMAEVGRNPARIIPAWRQFVKERGRPGTGIRGIGEPIWRGRTPHEIVECQLHEALVNVAFSGAEDLRLLCAYDVGVLSAAVIHEARCSHPYVVDDGSDANSREYRGRSEVMAPFDAPLPKPTSRAEVLSFDQTTLAEVRDLVMRATEAAGLGVSRARDLVCAVNELATNSVRHGGGNGVLRVWREDDALICEVRDRGWIADPLAGRHVPSPSAPGGRGLWIANQVCDLLQIRSAAATGTVVRVIMHCDAVIAAS